MTWVTRRVELGALFAALLSACAEGDDKMMIDASGPPTDGCGSTETEIVEIPADEAIEPLDCAEVCEDVAPDATCTLVEGSVEGSNGDASGSTGSTGTPESAAMVPVECTYTSICIGGRASAAWASRPIPMGSDASAGWLAQAAHDEAASVASFRLLAAELAAHGVPEGLRARIDEAAADEARHAHTMTALARARGAEPIPVRLRPVPSRTLEQIAIENAVEGCARETFNALVAAHQAEHAAWPAVQRAMAGIAEDERRHAELAWAIDAWLADRLDPEARARVRAARQHALAELCARPGAAVGVDAQRVLGLPHDARARALAEGLRKALSSARG